MIMFATKLTDFGRAGLTLIKSLAVTAFFICAPIAAQQENLEPTFAREFEDCAYKVGLRLIADKGVYDLNTVAKAVFRACDAEERDIYTALYAARSGRRSAAAIVRRLRLRIEDMLGRMILETEVMRSPS